MLVQEADYSAKVFVQSSIPRSWHEMEYQCRSSGGHLVSFDTQVSLISKGIKRNEDFLCPRNLISRFVYDEV